jgi:hypothetical protein
VAIFWFDLNVVIAPVDIKRSKERFALELFENMGDLGYGVDVLDRPLVNLSVVLYRSWCAIFLLDKEEGG